MIRWGGSGAQQRTCRIGSTLACTSSSIPSIGSNRTRNGLPESEVIRAILC